MSVDASTRAAGAMWDLVSQAMALDGPGAMVRRDDPVTSHEAADSISREALEASEAFVLEVLADGPAIDEAIINLAVLYGHRWGPSRLRTARKQLADRGKVRDSGEKGETRSGRKAIVWEVVS